MRHPRNSKGRFTKRSHSKRRKHRSRRRKHNPLFKTKAAYAAMKKPRKRRRKASRKRAGRRIRPTIIVGKSGRYHRPRRSKYFKRARLVNPKRRRRSHRKHLARRRNGIGGNLKSIVKNVLTPRTLTGYLAMGGGFLGGSYLKSFVTTGYNPFGDQTKTLYSAEVLSFMSGSWGRPLACIINIIVGSLVMSKGRNRLLKDAGLGLAASGGYGLLTEGLAALKIPVPGLYGMNVDLLGKTMYAGHSRRLSGMNVDLRGDTYKGMNVTLMGDARSSDAENEHLADNINDMIS